MLQKTLGHVIYGFGAHGSKGRRKSDSKWITGTFNPDGQTFKDRYGFTLEETNGSHVGERGPSDDLQDVIRNPDNPFMIENNSAYQVRTYWDVCDCRYVITSGGDDAYDKIVKPVLDKYQSVVTPPVVVEPPVIVPPVTTPSVDPCQTFKDQVSKLDSQLTIATSGLSIEIDKRHGLENLLEDILVTAKTARTLAKVDLTARGGGAPMVQLRRLINKIIEITGPL